MSAPICPHCDHELARSRDGRPPENCPECGYDLGSTQFPDLAPRRARHHYLRLDASSLVCRNCGTIDSHTIHRSLGSSLRNLLPHWLSVALRVGGGQGLRCKSCGQIELVAAGSEDGRDTLHRFHPGTQVMGNLGQRRRILIGTVAFFTVIVTLTMLTWLLVFPRLHRWIENADVAASIPRQAVIEDCQRMLRDSGRLNGQILFEDRDLNVGNNDSRWWVDGEVIITDAGGIRNRKFYSCSMRYLDRKPQLDLLEIH